MAYGGMGGEVLDCWVCFFVLLKSRTIKFIENRKKRFEIFIIVLISEIGFYPKKKKNLK